MDTWIADAALSTRDGISAGSGCTCECMCVCMCGGKEMIVYSGLLTIYHPSFSLLPSGFQYSNILGRKPLYTNKVKFIKISYF